MCKNVTLVRDFNQLHFNTYANRVDPDLAVLVRAA